MKPANNVAQVDVLESPWLIHMLAKASPTPQGRLLSLFDILDDWLNAPSIEKPIALMPPAQSVLVQFCTEQAKALGAEDPTMLAEHIVLIARTAALQAKRQPQSNSLLHAKKAAHALILAQTQKPSRFRPLVVSACRGSKTLAYSTLALVLIMLTGGLWLQLSAEFSQPQAQVAQNDVMTMQTTSSPQTLTAAEASSMYAKYEQMRQGTCQFPEVLQIPDKHKAIYLENVVGGKLPSDLNDLAIANYYLEKVRCNFTPMLMAESK